jgi:hypothetical protein
MYLSLIILPLLGSIVSGFFGRKVGVNGAQLITSSGVIITTMLSILCFIEVGLNNIPVSINLFRWIDSEWFNIIWGFQYDSLTVNSADSYYIWWILAVLVWIQLCKVDFLWALLAIKTDFFGIEKQMFKLINNKRRTSIAECSQLSPFIIKSKTSFLNNRILTSRAYSTKQDKFNMLVDPDLDTLKDDNFFKWFVGFADAESNFIINVLWKNDKVSISKFSFIFKITLHCDDEYVLRIIKEKLGVGGNLRRYKNESIFNVTDKKGIEKLIQIFERYNLNTTKYLDYLDFKKAFIIYNKEQNLKIDLVKDAILEFKKNMNKNRVNFLRPTDIEINKYWLLGFIEGDGSFFVRRDPLVPTFSIELSDDQLPVVLKIKEFLENNLGFDSYSIFKLSNSSIMSIIKSNTREKSKPSVLLVIKNIKVLHNYLIPFFNEMGFLSKKGLDFVDFRIITNAIYNGAHRIDEIKELILKLSYNMNNYRLSTNKNPVDILSKEERDKLIYINPTVNYLFDGRQRDVLTNKVLHQQVSCVYEICKPNNEIILANTLQEAGLIVKVSPETLSRRLNSTCTTSEQYLEIKGSLGLKIRRIGVFN